MANELSLSSPSVEVRFTDAPSIWSSYSPRSPFRTNHLLAILVEILRSTIPAMSNTLFTAGEKLSNFGASTFISFSHTQTLVRLMQLQLALIGQQAVAWQRYAFNPDAPADVDSISETIELIFECVSRFGPEAIDLRGLDARKIHGEHLAAVLRATFSWRDQTPGWTHALEVAADALERVHVDPHLALVGLR